MMDTVLHTTHYTLICRQEYAACQHTQVCARAAASEAKLLLPQSHVAVLAVHAASAD
jgi:hypothetical protein